MIINQLFDDEKMKEVAIYVLKHHPECCLIVLDGVDEWKGSSTSETGRRGDITGLPSLAGVENCVILITSRPWRFQALSLNTQKIFRRLMINGIKNVQELANRILQQLGDPDPHQSSYEFLDQVEEKNMSELMKIPLILIIALGGWVDDKSFHKSMSINYINMIQSFIRRSKGQAGWSSSESKLRQLIPNLEKQENVWEEISNELPHFLSRYKLFQRYAGLFLSLGQLAFDLLLGTEEQSLVFSKGVLQSYLPADDENDESVNVCLALGILTKTETATRGLKKLESYAFCHKTFQEFFAALWLTSKFSNEKTKLLKCIKNVRDLNSYVILIMFLCGIDPTAGKQFWLDFAEEVEFKGLQAQEVVLKCMKEQTSDQIYFFIPHIYIRGGEEMTLDDIMLLCNVMEEYSDNVKSLNASEYYLELEDLIKVFRSVSSCSGLQSLRLWDVSFFNEESDSIRHHLVLNLQKHNKLEKLKLSEIFVAGLLLPVEGDRITSLDLLYVEMAHHDLKQLGKSLSSCSSLETIKLNKVTCSEHRDRPCSIVLDLHKHDKLEKLKLEYLSVDSLLLPVEGARLTTLKLRNVTMTHHGLKQLEKYLSSSSSLEKMDLDEVTCGEHRDRCCSLVLDLQKHHQLEKLKLGNSSIECLLLSMEGARITSLTLYNLTMTFHGMEQLGEFLSSCSSLETLARITFLSMIDLTMTHHGLKQLGKSLSFCSSLQIVYLSKVTCSEHRDRSCIIDLDLQKHNKLVTLVLRCLSVGSLLLPAGGARITSLELENVTMTHHDLKQLGKSLPSCSSLETIKLNEVTCSEHRDRSCSLVLDLQKHDKLEKLGLGNSSIECVLLPMEGTRIFALYLINVTITHHSLEQMLKYQLNSLNIKLVGVKCYEHRDGSCKPVQDLRERFSRWWK